jgi:hypothetical protein
MLQENMTVHAMIGGGINPDSRWICKQQGPSIAIFFMKCAYLELTALSNLYFITLNVLSPVVTIMYHQIYHTESLQYEHRVCLSVFYGPQNIQQLLPYCSRD